MIELLRQISIDNKLRLLSMVPLVLLVLVSGFMVWQLYTESVETIKWPPAKPLKPLWLLSIGLIPETSGKCLATRLSKWRFRH